MLDRVLEGLKRQALVIYAGVGMGIYRCLHEWPIWFNDAVYHGSAGTLFSGADFFMFVDAGKIVGLIAYVALCFSIDRARRNEALMAAPSLLCAFCLLGPALFTLGVPVAPGLMLAAFFGGGAAAGMLFAQWIEFFGTVPPVKTVQALALSYVVRFALLPLLTFDAATDVWAMVGLALISVLLVAYCTRETQAGFLVSREAPKVASLLSRNGLLFLFVVLFAFAYGLGSGVTDLSHAPAETGWGKVAPSVLVLALVLKLGDRFDRTILYALALPLMAMGLLGVVFLGLPLSLSQVLLSAGFSMFHLLVYVMVCSETYRTRASAMPAGACVRALALVAADAAILLFKALPADTHGPLVVVVVIASIAAAFAALMPRLGIESVRGAAADAEGKAKARRNLASAHGLSERETTVFALLLDGKTAAQISEELFISNGAVRAHCSRIYDKFGVHSRKDFDALFEGRG